MMYNYYDCWNPVFVSLYFTIVVIMGSFFLLNLLLAAIYSNFTKVRKRIEEEKDKETPAQQLMRKSTASLNS